MDFLNEMLNNFIKVIIIDLDKDSFEEVKVRNEDRVESGSIMSWLNDFAFTHVHPADVRAFIDFMDTEKLYDYFAGSSVPLYLFYRRKEHDRWRWVCMLVNRIESDCDEHKVYVLINYANCPDLVTLEKKRFYDYKNK